MKITILELAGIETAFKAMRLPFEGESKGIQKDLELAASLIKSGDSHAKFSRMIDVWLEIDAPRYWWQEFDTYRMGVEKVSSSTMNLLGKRPLVKEDFAHIGAVPDEWIEFINNVAKSDAPRLMLKCILPESFIQRRIVKVSYQALHSMYRDRKNHRLEEWHQFFRGIRSFDLPYANELIFEEVSE